jgi:hypothetical protein
MQTHIGSIIKNHCRQQFITNPQLAQLLNCKKDAIYKLYLRPNISADTLLKVSKALNHDFFQYYQSSLGPNPAKEIEKLTSELNKLKKENEKLLTENLLLKQLLKLP